MDNYGVLSLVPPILAIFLAIRTKQVIISFFVAVWAGATVLAKFNPLLGLINVFNDYVLQVIADPFNASVLFSTLVIGAFTAMIEKGGGSFALAECIKKSRIKTRKQGQILTWLGGVACFFSDSTNAMVIGPIFKPITDLLKISREKLAYIVDSTSSPMALLVPFSTWGAFLVSLISEQFEIIGRDEASTSALIKSIPANFYALGAILLVFIIAVTGFDFGPMRKAERKAYHDNVTNEDEVNGDSIFTIPKDAKPTLLSAIVPLVVLVVTLLSMLVWTGGFPEKSLFDGLISGNPTISIAFSFFSASIVAAIFAIKSKVLNVKESINVWFNGTKSMIEVLFILMFSWSIGRVCGNLGTSNFIVSTTEGFLTPTLIYIIVFIGACLTSFATGSSWGTFAIFMPISIPLAASTGSSIYAAIAATLGGGLFGDHASPLSDTTILSSMGAACNHLDHVKTQLPYGIVVAVASIIGYLIVGITNNIFIGLIIMLISLLAIVYFCAKNDQKKEQGEVNQSN